MSQKQCCIHLSRPALTLAAILFGVSLLHAEEPAPEPPTPDWNTPRQFDTLSPHPRLYVSPAQLQRAVKGRGEAFGDIGRIERAALTGLADADDPMAEHNMMRKQIWIVGRLSAMALQYHRTGDKRYIEASVQTIENMRGWYTGLWQLWHGGYSTAIAISYDLLHHDMTPEQRKRVVDFSREHVIRPFLRRTARGKDMKKHGEHGSWWQNIISNWNPVCNSGAGLLAIAMYDDLDEAQTVIDRVNASFDPIIEYLQETEGGWVEGLGYWNWTIHYMSLFYISYERAFQAEHAGFRSPGFAKTLTFVEYFVPYDQAAGFGDNQHGNISNSLLAAAERLGNTECLKRLQYYLRRRDATSAQKKATRAERAGATTTDTKPDGDAPVNIGYGEVNTLLIRPDLVIDDSPAPTRPYLLHMYPKQGWIALADRWPEPNVHAAIRAGQLGGAHTQDDLLTWHGIIGNELMIQNIYQGHVSQNAYANRRNELYEVGIQSKNALFVGGLGPAGSRGTPAKANTTQHLLPTGPMVVLEATRAMNTTRNRPSFVARAFLAVGDRGILVLDRIIAPRGGGQPVEARAFTPHTATFSDNDVLIEGEFQTARMSFAASVGATLTRALPLMTFPKPNPPTMMRWQTNRAEKSTVMASLLSRGAHPVELNVRVNQAKAPDSEKMVDDTITVTIKSDGWNETITLTDRLKPIE